MIYYPTVYSCTGRVRDIFNISIYQDLSKESVAATTDSSWIIQECQGLEFSAPEEISFCNGWINKAESLDADEHYEKKPCENDLRDVYQGKVGG